MNSRYHQYYRHEVCQNLLKTSYKNVYQIPKITKIIINRGLGEASQNKSILDASLLEFQLIGGQKGIVTKSRKAISSFKLRQKMPVGICVTLRQHYMYNFLDRLLNLALPRIRDFHGLSYQNFDGYGNYSLGLKEQLMFPEIQYDQIDKVRGMDVTIVTSAKNDQEGFHLLKQFGFPFYIS